MIVEIGPRPYVARAFAADSLFFATEAAVEAAGVETLPSLAILWQALARPDVDLVVCHPTFSAPWGLRHWSRTLVSRRLLEGRAAITPPFGPQLLRGRRRRPVAV